MRDKVSPAVFMIDMSNVCWDKSIASQGTAGPRMLRFERVHEALLDADPNASIEVVADNSLRHTLVDTSAREWREIRDRYSIAEVPVADELILLRASSEPDMVVVSRDQFMDHRKEHPWITEQPHRFMKPVTRSGSVHLVPSGIRFEPHQAVSRMVEAKEFKRLGIDLNAHGNIMGSHWKCVNSRCLQSQLWDMLLLWPAVDQSGHARCPTCTEPLTAAGPRPTTRQLIVFDSATKQEVLRFPVQQGTPLIVGRSALRNGISSMPTAVPRWT
ncbi:hypothetical protein BJF84_10430 [Rhodococcus sp. CUA-806]|nr:hypothetical protein BJF84_10430 [Rhodococcus sp. CUA-806]